MILTQIGLNASSELSNASGDLFDVRFFNAAKEFLGVKYDLGSIGNEKAEDIRIQQSVE